MESLELFGPLGDMALLLGLSATRVAVADSPAAAPSRSAPAPTKPATAPIMRYPPSRAR
mgnify:CR=1 FL=1